MNLILWSLEAHREIQNILDNHPEDNSRIVTAIRELYRELQIDAANWGESRNDTQRLGCIIPLWSLIDVDPMIQEVRILAVAYATRRPRPF